MPFVKIDPIEEAKELQELFKDDKKVVEEFKNFELAHIEAEQFHQEELELRSKLVEIRKLKNITQKDIEKATGLSQQAISRIEIGKDFTPSLRNILKYAEAVGCKIMPVIKSE